jgi:serine/tyrosine/threonine adenylyltransferase
MVARRANAIRPYQSCFGLVLCMPSPIAPLGNPLLNLAYEPSLESLGGDYFDGVAAAEFPAQILRWRNDGVLPIVGLDPSQVTDQDFLEAFGAFAGRSPFLALRYHGYQFGEYNPRLGDGRGFLYGQVRGVDGRLYDLGTKGSGTTPYSRSGDGRLTLKGGIREVIAAETLQAQGVTTSRCLSLVETGEPLWRGDEPSPTRSSVMVRFQQSHIRFGTFERLHHIGRSDLIETLLDHAIAVYYPHLAAADPSADPKTRRAQFYAELVDRVAQLSAQWTSAGFCHAVLNTDNMVITGESFDYGPFAFLNTYDPQFTAAYFDHGRRYSYGNQPGIGHLNLEFLQTPLRSAIDPTDLETGLATYDDAFRRAYGDRMMNRLGLAGLAPDLTADLLRLTSQLLYGSQVQYHEFFANLRRNFRDAWLDDVTAIDSTSLGLDLAELASKQPGATERPGLDPGQFEQWRDRYHLALMSQEPSQIQARLVCHNPLTVPTRPVIEAVWEPIAASDDWGPFYDLMERITQNR